MSSAYSGPQNHLASTANRTDDKYRDTAAATSGSAGLLRHFRGKPGQLGSRAH
jgi:hypothetical protein